MKEREIIDEFIGEIEEEREVEQLKKIKDYWWVPSFDPKRRAEGIGYWVIEFWDGTWACDCNDFIKKDHQRKKTDPPYFCKHILYIKGQEYKKVK